MRAASLALVLAFSWANRAGCCCLAGHAPYTVRKALPPADPARAGEPPVPELRAAVFGDFGDDTCQQRAVARGLAASHARAPFDLVIQTGDNLYDCGPDASLSGAADCAFAPDGNTAAPGYAPPPDPRFRRLSEGPLEPLTRGDRPVPVWLVLGNHDVASGPGCGGRGLLPEKLGRLRACLEVAHHGPHWQMPGRHYLRDEGPARFVFLDTNVLAGDYGGFSLDDELSFFREATRGCDARPCFVVGHHPPASAGSHGEGAMAVERLRRLQESASGPIAAWLGGHDHDLQHLRSAAGYDVFVSGNGSRWRDERFAEVGPAGAQLLFASTAWGHAVLEVRGRSWSVRFESEAGEPLHCCRAEHPGACRPEACGLPALGPTRPASAP